MLPRTATKHLVLDGELLAEIDEVRDSLRLARLSEQVNGASLGGEAPRLEQLLMQLGERAAAEAIRFTVRALPGEVFDDLCRRHPVSTEQLTRFREQAKSMPWAEVPEFNPQTMGPDLLVACLTEPAWPEDEIREFWRNASKGEQNQLWNLALGVQVQGADLPFLEAATATTSGGGDRSTIAANGASPSQSS